MGTFFYKYMLTYAIKYDNIYTSEKTDKPPGGRHSSFLLVMPSAFV